MTTDDGMILIGSVGVVLMYGLPLLCIIRALRLWGGWEPPEK